MLVLALALIAQSGPAPASPPPLTSHHGRHTPHVTPAPAPPSVQPIPAPQPPAKVLPSPQSAAVVVATDPYGFGSWLNTYRASAGLRPLAYDPGLTASCAENSRRGFGHHFFGRCRRQNAGYGGNIATISQMWVASPPHRSALLDPHATCYGIALYGSVWTYGTN